jgi:diguanylate cyclase (GGDEF)-like protein
VLQTRPGLPTAVQEPMDAATTRRLLRELRGLAALHDAGDLAAVLRTLGDALVAVLRLDQAHLLLFQPGGSTIWGTVVTPGAAEEYVLAAGDGGSAVDWVASTRRPLVVAGPLRRMLPGDLVAVHGLDTAVLLPLVAAGALRGVVVAGSREPRPWSEAEVEAAGALVDVAGAPIAVADVRHAARIDPLTGCLNRGAMEERLTEEIDRAQRQGTPLACVLFDLDDFKAINDGHGHQAGDAVLRRVGTTLLAEFRSFDLVARYGGDEFLAILPNASGADPGAAARRVLHALNGTPLAPLGAPGRILGTSAGVAQWRPSETAEDLVARADAALLAGKRAGKNRIGAAPAEPS